MTATPAVDVRARAVRRSGSAGRRPRRRLGAATLALAVGLAEPGLYDKWLVRGRGRSGSRRRLAGRVRHGGAASADRHLGDRRRRGLARRLAPTPAVAASPSTSGRACSAGARRRRHRRQLGLGGACACSAVTHRDAARASCARWTLRALGRAGPGDRQVPIGRPSASIARARRRGRHPGLHDPRRPATRRRYLWDVVVTGLPWTSGRPREAPGRVIGAAPARDRLAAARRGARRLKPTTSSSSAAASTAWRSPTSSRSAACATSPCSRGSYLGVGRQRPQHGDHPLQLPHRRRASRSTTSRSSIYERPVGRARLQRAVQPARPPDPRPHRARDRRPARPRRDEPARWASTRRSSSATRSGSSRPALDLSNKPRFPIHAAL